MGKTSPYAYVGLGFEIAMPVALCTWLGYRLDIWLASGPWFVVLGALAGMAIGFYGLFRRVLPRAKNGDDGTNR